MMTMKFFVDYACGHLNKHGEELCGDTVKFYRNKERMIAVLSDGLGSGVKANILSTLTCSIAMTMLKEGLSIDECVDTIIHTLPICKVRQLAYSTFSIVQVDKNGMIYVVEFDNPNMFLYRNGEMLHVDKVEREINGRVINETTFQLEIGDTLVFVSDGVIHAGVGKTLNLGWGWEDVNNYLALIVDEYLSANKTMNILLNEVSNLYKGDPGDDVTVMCLKVIKEQQAVLFSGPPLNPSNDKEVVNILHNAKGKKIVCGGTAANIVSREINEEIKTSFEIYDSNIPPIAYIHGIDLVTEGVLTLKGTVKKLEKIKNQQDLSYLGKHDGSSLLTQLLFEECTNIKFLVGKAINPAHQNPDFPQELSIKLNIIKELEKVLVQLGKWVDVEYY